MPVCEYDAHALRVYGLGGEEVDLSWPPYWSYARPRRCTATSAESSIAWVASRRPLSMLPCRDLRRAPAKTRASNLKLCISALSCARFSPMKCKDDRGAYWLWVWCLTIYVGIPGTSVGLSTAVVDRSRNQVTLWINSSLPEKVFQVD